MSVVVDAAVVVADVVFEDVSVLLLFWIIIMCLLHRYVAPINSF